MNKKIARSLKLQLFFSVLIALCVAAAVFVTALTVGGVVIDDMDYGRSFTRKMPDNQSRKLQKFINEEAVSLSAIQRLNVWCSRGKNIYLTVYHEDKLIYESNFARNPYDEFDPSQYSPDSENPNVEYALTLSDGTEVRAFLYYYAAGIVYLWVVVISGILAFISFSLCFFFLVKKKVSYITRLREELEILAGSQLEYPITIQGKDEIAELALGIDQMRKSILKHQEVEKQMRSANSELITSMSHDLRTPLTSLLAYLEFLERKKYTDEEQMQNLLHKSVAQTMRIRDMADKLFQYFLVYATEWEDARMEPTDADILFSQMLEDYASALENKGLQVDCAFSEVSGQIIINSELFQRAMDNLYSNLMKYADPSKTVKFAYQKNGNKLQLTLQNGVSPDREKKESTQIGLNTCRRIIEFHNGTFFTKEEDAVFTVTVELPLTETGNM